LLILFAFLGAASLLHAANDPRGDYQGTIQCTSTNDQAILQQGIAELQSHPAANRNQEETRQTEIEAQQFHNQGYLKQLQQAGITNANPLTVMIISSTGGQYGLSTGPGSSNYIQLTIGDLWYPTSDNQFGAIQSSWRPDGFEIVRTKGDEVFRIAGNYNGATISGQWSVTQSGTQLLAGVFSATRQGDAPGGGPASAAPPSPASANGQFNGTIISTDATTTTGRITFTITGSTVHGGVSGTWKQAAAEQSNDNGGSGPSAYASDTEGPQPDAYTGNFSGSFDAASGSFEADMTGEVYDYKFTGHIRGTVQGYSAHGTWDATNQFGGSSGTWTASRPAPAVPAGGGPGSSSGEGSNSGGAWVHTGSGNDADDYTWVPNSQPAGISGVNDVPGPADLPETGTGILLPGLLTMAGIGLKSLLDSSATPPPLVDYGSVPDGDSGDGSDGSDSSDSSDAFTDSMTDSLVNTTPSPGAADTSSTPAPQTPPAPSPYGADYDQAVKDSQSATSDYNGMLKQYADFQNGADTTDPQYKVLDQQYKDYLDYLKNKADSNSASADAIAAAAVKQQNTQVLKDYWGNDKEVVYDPTTGQWHDAQTGNLFDPDAWQKSQQDNAAADAWGQSETQKMESQQDADSKILNQMIRDEKKREAELNYLGKLQKMAYDTYLTDPGEAHDVFVTTQNMMNDLLDGKTVTVPQILETRQYLHDRLLGNAEPESILSLPENQPVGLINADGAYRTVRGWITGRDENGKFTFTSLVSAALFNVGATMVLGPVAKALLGRPWVVDAALVTSNTYYAGKDAIAHGSSSLGALGSVILEAVIQGGPQAGVGLILQHAPSSAIGMMIKRVVTPMTDSQKFTRSMVDKVLASDDPADVIRLYRAGGMTKLGDLQAAGHLTPTEVAVLNSRLGCIVNDQVGDATQLAIRQFQSRTGVRIDQTIIADSGSSARGPNYKAFTDYDRTHVTRFNQADLEQYAIDHQISVEEANHNLQSLFGNQLTDNVDNNMRSLGFFRGTEDIHYSTYNGIGAGAGQMDAYGAGVTGANTKFKGTGTEYNINCAGNVTSVRNITGTAVVDQHGLNVAEVTGELPSNPDKFSPDEFVHFSNQQVLAVQNYSDPKSMAKALIRQSELAQKVEHAAGNSAYTDQLRDAGYPMDANGNPLPPPQLDNDLVAVADAIKKNPGQTNQILAANNFTNASFRDAVAQELVSFHNGIGGAAR
jgi:hypothetical protein